MLAMNNIIHNESTDNLMQEPQNPKKIKGKRYKGLLEWILDREGHELLV